MKTEIEKEPVKLFGADELAQMLSVNTPQINNLNRGHSGVWVTGGSH